MIAVTPKTPLDLDGYSSTLAYAEFLNKKGKQAFGVVFGKPHQEIESLNQELNLQPLPSRIKILQQADEIILVDASSLKGLPQEIDPKKVTEVIDHRQSPETAILFPNAKIQIERVGAAATLITEKFKEDSVPISQEAGIFLYSAIASHTFNFKTHITTDRDKAASHWLEQQATIPKTLVPKILALKSQFNNKSLREAIVNDFKEVEINHKLVGIAQLEVSGIRKILQQKEKQVIRVLEGLQRKRGFDSVFLTVVDFGEETNFLVTSHRPTKRLLESTLAVSFDNRNLAERPGILLRKEIIPLLRNSSPTD